MNVQPGSRLSDIFSTTKSNSPDSSPKLGRFSLASSDAGSSRSSSPVGSGGSSPTSSGIIRAPVPSAATRLLESFEGAVSRAKSGAAELKEEMAWQAHGLGAAVKGSAAKGAKAAAKSAVKAAILKGSLGEGINAGIGSGLTASAEGLWNSAVKGVDLRKGKGKSKSKKGSSPGISSKFAAGAKKGALKGAKSGAKGAAIAFAKEVVIKAPKKGISGALASGAKKGSSELTKSAVKGALKGGVSGLFKRK
ncbi:putative coiled coil protein [Candidatus Ichthyocystis hellenicum]|uniref:Putative coiled coil protein n=1 Tax=Candidatus Ichthyocystis hellenicum TaxID=1561003 RepID=A0A0S4M345_9BURK|nr:hypothetical protein [Candidatus Ichthyocystis hellenicum]CUT18197.1 putative coiled coil protein [Candidatus Ichthyocystis hellenicum]